MISDRKNEYIHVVEMTTEYSDKSSDHAITSFSDGYAAFNRMLQIVNDANKDDPDNMWEFDIDHQWMGRVVVKGFGSFQFGEDEPGVLRAGVRTVTITKIPCKITPIQKKKRRDAV